MPNQGGHAWNPGRVVPIVVAVWLAVGLPARAAAECTSKTYKIDLPDPATMKLSDGEHTIGSVRTTLGTLDVRVTVKSKDISQPFYTVAGQRLTVVSASSLPADLRECMKEAGASAPSLDTWLSRVTRSALDWIVVPAQAATVRAINQSSVVFHEACLRGTKDHQVCTYTACFRASDGSSMGCVQLFVTGK
jgi:hypothetical protein